MLVFPILLALVSSPCEEKLPSVVTALQRNDMAQAAKLLEAAQPDCTQSGAFFGLTGIWEELFGQPLAAEQALEKAILLDSRSARLHEQLGALYLRHKKAANAIKPLRVAVALDEANATAKKYLIGAYVESGEWGEAAKLFDAIGGLGSHLDDPIMALWLARTLIETQQFSRLNRDLSPEQAGMTPGLLFSLGGLLAQHGMYARAVEYLSHIQPADADDAVYFNLGLCYSHLQEFSEARRSYFKAIDKHPGHVEAYFHVGLDYGSTGQSRMAIPWLMQAYQWGASRADIAYALVEQLIQLRYFDTAQEILVQSLTASRNHPLLLTAQGDLKQLQGDVDAAIESYRRALEQSVNFVPALVGVARAEAAKGQNEEAQKALKLALASDANNGAAAGELGLIEVKLGANDSALKYLKMAWEQTQVDERVAFALCHIYQRLGQPAEALKVLAPLQTSEQDSLSLHLELAQIYRQLQRTAEAEKERQFVTEWQAQTQGVLRFESPGTYVH